MTATFDQWRGRVRQIPAMLLRDEMARRRADRIVAVLTDYGAMTSTQIADEIDESVSMAYGICKREPRVVRCGLVQTSNRGGTQSCILWGLA